MPRVRRSAAPTHGDCLRKSKGPAKKAGPAPARRSERGNVVLVNHCGASQSITAAIPLAYAMSQRRAAGSAAICSDHWCAMLMMCLCAGRRIQRCIRQCRCKRCGCRAHATRARERGIHALCHRVPRRGWPGGAGGRVVNRMQRGISVYTGLLNVSTPLAVVSPCPAGTARQGVLLYSGSHAFSFAHRGSFAHRALLICSSTSTTSLVRRW
jgi:hypothetical protein